MTGHKAFFYQTKSMCLLSVEQKMKKKKGEEEELVEGRMISKCGMQHGVEHHHFLFCSSLAKASSCKVEMHSLGWKPESWGLINTVSHRSALGWCIRFTGWKLAHSIIKHSSFQPWNQEDFIHLLEYSSEHLFSGVSSSCILQPRTAWSPRRSEEQPSRFEMWVRQVNRRETRLSSPAGTASGERRWSTNSIKTSPDLWCGVRVQFSLASRVPAMGPVLGVGQQSSSAQKQTQQHNEPRHTHYHLT